MKPLNTHLKEALGYFLIGILFFVCITNPIWAVVIFIFRICLFILGGILVLASIGKVSDYFNRNKNEKENNNCPRD